MDDSQKPKMGRIMTLMQALGTQYELRIGWEGVAEDQRGEEDDHEIFLHASLYFLAPKDDGWSDEQLMRHFKRIHPGDRHQDKIIGSISGEEGIKRNLIRFLLDTIDKKDRP